MSSMDSMLQNTRNKGRVQAPRKLWVNAILSRCEVLLAEGRKPTLDTHKEIVDALRSGQDASWASYPLTQSWFTQI